jgi:hypothetical protein
MTMISKLPYKAINARNANFMKWVALLAASFFVQNVHATLILDFEEFTDNTNLVNQIPGITFSNATVLTSSLAGGQLNEIDFPPHSEWNVAAGLSGWMEMEFASPQDGFSAFFTFSSPLTLVAYDAGFNVLGTFQSVNGSVLGSWEEISVSLAGMSKIAMNTQDSSDFTMDDAKVPEPSSLWLFATAGLVAAGRWRANGKRLYAGKSAPVSSGNPEDQHLGGVSCGALIGRS